MTLLPCSLRNRARLFILCFVLLFSAFFFLNHIQSRTYGQIFTPGVTVVSAATLEATAVAPDSIAVAFTSLPGVPTTSAGSTPLPTMLGGVTARLRDSAGVTRDCGLFFVSAQQINFLLPPGTAPGAASLTILFQSRTQIGTVQIARVNPGLFSANATGQGAAIGFLLIVPQQGAQVYEPLMQFDSQKGQFVSRPVLLARQTIQSERLFFVFYGTGIRGRGDGSTAAATIGGIRSAAAFAGAIPGLSGLDQINIPIDPAVIPQLTGRGRVNVALTIRDTPGIETTSNVIEIEVADRGAPSTLSITSVQPTRALAGETITILGTGFATSLDGNRVRISGSEVQVIEATATQLKARVPFGAQTGPVTIATAQGEAASPQLLTIRTSLSGIIEDTSRRPIKGVMIGFIPISSAVPIATAETNSEGVFLLPDLPAQLLGSGVGTLSIIGDAAAVTPQLPRFQFGVTAIAGRDNPLPRPIALQLPSDNGFRLNTAGIPATASLTIPATENKNEQMAQPPEPGQIACSLLPGTISFSLQSPYTRCETTQECQAGFRSLFLTTVENSRAPTRLPNGHFSSTMVQITPTTSFFLSSASLTLPNTDCLPPGPARLFSLQTGDGFLFTEAQSQIPLSQAGTFIDIGTATVAPNGQSISIGEGLLQQGGLYFVSVQRGTATITGRVLSPEPTGAEGRTVLTPVRRAMIVARGQDALTDGNGAFILRNVPVLRANDSVAIEISYLRPNGRVEHESAGNLAVVADGTVAAGDITLPAATTNRLPAILAMNSVTTKVGERSDVSLLVSDADTGQTVQASMTGPSFASLVNLGAGKHTLRLIPAATDAGEHTVTINAVDSTGGRATSTVRVSVRGTATNQPPVADALAVATDEDKLKTFVLTGSDPNRDALRYTVLTQPAHGSLFGTAPDVTYTPNENYFGPDSFTFKVNDGVVDSAPATVSITVAPVNDAPRLMLPIEQKIAAGQELRIQITATDVDVTDQVAISAPVLPAGAVFNPAPAQQGGAGLFIWTPTQAQIGTSIVAFRATDNATMPQTTQRTLAITVTAANAPPTAGIWNPTTGPTGGAVNAFIARGATVLAASPIGIVFRSTNGGESWAPLPATAFNGSPIGAFATVGNTLLASTGFTVYRSTDDGLTWTPSVPFIAIAVTFFGSTPTALAVKGSLVFATFLGQLYVSSDAGLSWTTASTGLPINSSVVSVVASGNRIFAFVANAGVYRSDDDGKSWVASGQGLPSNLAGVELFAGGNGLYLANSNSVSTSPNVYASTDSGQTWALLTLPAETYPVRKMIFTADQWLVSTPQKVFSLARQANQTITATLLFEKPFIAALAASDGSLFAGTLLEGIFRSTDKGANWRTSNTGLHALRVNALHTVGTNLFAATSAGVFVSSDQGQTWQTANSGFVSAISGDVVFGGFSLLYISPIDITSMVSIPATDRTYLFAAQENSSLYRSSDLGKTWEPVEGLPQLSTVSALGVNGTDLFAGITLRGLPMPGSGPVYRSTDFGKSWRSASTGLPSGVPLDFAALGTRIFLAIDQEVYVSTNNGDQWQSASSGLPADTFITTLAIGVDRLYAGTYGNGIFVLTNNSQAWMDASSTLPKAAIIRDLFVDGSNVFAVSPSEDDSPCPRGGVLIEGRCYGVLLGGLGSINASLLRGSGAGKVYFSPNQGQSWATIASGINETNVTAFGGGGGAIFVGSSGSGVFLRRF